MRILNKNKNIILAEEAFVAKSLYSRIKGLIAREALLRQEALVINRCNSIHTFFMRFPIDVLFVDKKNKIVGIGLNIKPWRLSPIYWKAKFVVEFPAGVLLESKTQKGDELKFV